MLIAIEGVDGAGKRTLTEGLRAAFEARRQVRRAAWPSRATTSRCTPTSPPRRCTAGTATSSSSVYAMAVLFALDRADARDEIDRLRAAHDVVILDRYVASNAAYSAARLHQGVDGEVVTWVRDAGVRPLRHARARLAGAARGARPSWPPNGPQRRAEAEPTAPATPTSATTVCSAGPATAYAALAAADWGGRWVVAGPDVDRGRSRARRWLADRRTAAKRPVW